MIRGTDILRWHERYGWPIPMGEWGVIQGGHRTPFRAVLEENDPVELETFLDSGLSEVALVAGIVSGTEGGREFMGGAARFNLVEWKKASADPDVERLDAPDVGYPVVLPHEGFMIMVDTPRHDHYAEEISRVLPGGTVLEIGSGYGGLALQLLRWNPAFRLVLVDLPSALYLAGYWLSRVCDAEVGWWDECPQAQILLVPSHELDQWGGTPDLAVATHSLSEFGAIEAGRYLAWLHEHEVRYFYHDNAVKKPVEYGDGRRTWEEWPEVLAAELVPGPPYVERWRKQIDWAMSARRYGEFFYERI